MLKNWAVIHHSPSRLTDTPESTAGDVEIEEVVIVLGLLGSRSIISIDSLPARTDVLNKFGPL